ncbi:hypothetical protein Hypma_003675 [Hypsizygus marmoreus]|uniref:Uncharacterized protein n=1 Tax=Hypsizygus marmoreus TaxID=39966 RepID=A0A369J830_HYPMA|nr:hypothetical protein Hypma_003675 [Hypsizygus marmoreus]
MFRFSVSYAHCILQSLLESHLSKLSGSTKYNIVQHIHGAHPDYQLDSDSREFLKAFEISRDEEVALGVPQGQIPLPTVFRHLRGQK